MDTRRFRCTASLALLSLLPLEQAFAENIRPLFARASAMGDTGVAAANLTEAPYFNPALLANSPKGLSIAFPIGARANDPEDLVDEIDRIQDELLVEYELTQSLSSATQLFNSFVGLSNETLKANISGMISINSSAGDVGIALSNLSSNKVVLKSDIKTQDLLALKNYIDGNTAATLKWWRKNGGYKKSNAANDIRGSDGSQFPPGVTENDKLYAFNSDLCGSYALQFEVRLPIFGVLFTDIVKFSAETH